MPTFSTAFSITIAITSGPRATIWNRTACTTRALALAIGLGFAGCGGGSGYRIEPAELQRLAATDPATRGARVRTVQNTHASADPPRAGAHPQHHAASPTQPLTSPSGEPATAMAGDGTLGLVGTSGVLGVAGASATGPAPYYAYPPTPQPSPAGRYPAPVVSGGTSSNDSAVAGSEGPPTDDTTRNKDDEILAGAAVVAGAAALGLGLGLSEGTRYDGWVRLTPSQPVHLYQGGKPLGWLPLSELSTKALQGVEYGMVSGEEGPVQRLERAPLSRQGFQYALELGAAGINAVERNDLPWGFYSRVGLGYFPTQHFGLLAGLGFGVSQSIAGDTLVDWRPFGELQVFPAHIGILHLGVYGNGGYSFGGTSRAGGQSTSLNTWFGGAGGLLQLELSTRLALTLRGGAVMLPSPGASEFVPEILAGIAVY